ncbi:JmjC domain-containing protein 7 [Elysia marginata]|uniref:JmjC domain-containing protein 7 n=1 Tax=Elysia marginata TaxID=1093978 RepID=A0AAV4JI35_9GAST|nr:JmjC domain-containing protein 7 [Elysia marginata]
MTSVSDYLFWIILFFSLLFSLNYVDATLPTFYPKTILSATESSCVVLVFSGKTADEKVFGLLQSLADVSFKDEPAVVVGKLALERDLSNFWPDSQPLKVQNELKRDILNQSIFVFGRLIKDRSCLLNHKKQMKLPTVFQYDVFPKAVQRSVSKMSEATRSIVNEINERCVTFRTTDGSINFKGLHRKEILENLFHISADSHESSADKDIHSYSFADGNESKCYSKTKGHCDSNICQIKEFERPHDECERIRVPSPAHFFHEYLSLSKPVIITGATDKWLAFGKWTKNFLKEKYGKTRVHIKATPDGEYEGVQDRSLWDRHKRFRIPKEVEEQLPYPDLVVERPASLDMLFSEFLDLIENISRGNVVNMSAYLEYSSINDYFPELKSDIKELEFINMIELASLNIWLSDGNTLGKLHFDPFDNLLCQISGEKHVTLFNPHNNERLYEGHMQETQFSYNKSTRSFHRNRLLDSTSMVMSPVDLKRPNLKRFPLFADARPMKCSIKAGEILFMPAFWWHEVQSRPNVSEHRNLAVNFWYKPFLTKEFPCPECRLDVNPKYYHLL